MGIFYLTFDIQVVLQLSLKKKTTSQFVKKSNKPSVCSPPIHTQTFPETINSISRSYCIYMKHLQLY